MKKILNLTFISLLFVSVMSCSDDDNTVASPSNAPELIAPEDNTAVVLDPEFASNPAITFVWNHAGYNVATEIDYKVEVALAGSNFAEPVQAGATTSNRFLILSGADLNAAALAAGLTPFEAGELDVRVTATLGDNAEMPMISNIVTINVTPYTTENPKLYIRGNFLSDSGYGPNWGDNTNPPFIAGDGFGSPAYEGFIYMNNANPEFKLIPNAVNFEGDYGDANASGSSGTLIQEGETNIKVSGPGYYLVRANTEELTYSVTPTQWGVVGNATPGGWDNSTPMTYDPATKKWSVTLTLTAQAAPDNGFKFRANNQWTYNLGDVVLADPERKLRYDGVNIGVATTGTYTITLDLSNPRSYSYTITPQ